MREKRILAVKWFTDSKWIHWIQERGMNLHCEMIHWLKCWHAKPKKSESWSWNASLTQSTKRERSESCLWLKWFTDSNTDPLTREDWLLVEKWPNWSADPLNKKGVSLGHEMIQWLKPWSTKRKRSESQSWPKAFTDPDTDLLNERGVNPEKNDENIYWLKIWSFSYVTWFLCVI